MSIINLVCVIIGLLSFVESKHVQFYRKDYTYVKEYDAFYKVHWDISGLAWSSAFNACYEEGAKLFYPSGDEWTIIKNLTDAMPVAPNTSEIFVGLHDEFNLGQFITIDGKPTDSPLNIEEDVTLYNRCVLMDYVTGQFRLSNCIAEEPEAMKPFICKKIDEESCPTIDHEYKYVKNTKKCYKVNHLPKTWEAAMQTCFMEGGILAIMKTKEDVPELPIKNNEYYFLGFRKMFSSSDFYTVTGNIWDSNNFRQNYNDDNNPDKKCGVVQFNNNYQVIQTDAAFCNALLPFICEMTAE